MRGEMHDAILSEHAVSTECLDFTFSGASSEPNILNVTFDPAGDGAEFVRCLGQRCLQSQVREISKSRLLHDWTDAAAQATQRGRPLHSALRASLVLAGECRLPLEILPIDPVILFAVEQRIAKADQGTAGMARLSKLA